jgi:hypothetical protein
LLREILDRKIEVRTGDTVRKISVREAMLTRFAEAGLKGDTKSAGFLLQRYDALEEPATAQAPALSDDQKIIDAFLEEYLRKRGRKT